MSGVWARIGSAAATHARTALVQVATEQINSRVIVPAPAPLELPSGSSRALQVARAGVNGHNVITAVRVAKTAAIGLDPLALAAELARIQGPKFVRAGIIGGAGLTAVAGAMIVGHVQSGAHPAMEPLLVAGAGMGVVYVGGKQWSAGGTAMNELRASTGGAVGSVRSTVKMLRKLPKDVSGESVGRLAGSTADVGAAASAMVDAGARMLASRGAALALYGSGAIAAVYEWNSITG